VILNVIIEIEFSFPSAVQGCLLEIDIILKSSDGTHFGSHVKNLETYSGGFPPSEFSNSNTGTLVPEVVSLPESSVVLSLLLRYMHNQRQPNSSGFKFDILSQLAEAAEKYMVFSAIEVCKIHMKSVLISSRVDFHSSLPQSSHSRSPPPCPPICCDSWLSRVE
jgi:hypothetical protein